MLKPLITTKPAFVVVGFEAAFIHALSPDATNLKVIGPLWCKILPEAHRVSHRVGEEMYGVIYGHPEAERTHPDELRYVAGVAVDSTSDVPDVMVAHPVDAGEFAVFIHRGPIDKIGETVEEIYRVWLPQSDYEHANVVDVERYDHRFQPDSADSEMEYWISLRPKT